MNRNFIECDKSGLQLNSFSDKKAGAIKLAMLLCKSFPKKLKLAIDLEKEKSEVFKEFLLCAKPMLEVIDNCDDILPKVAYTGLNFLSKDKKTIYLFVDNKNKNPILIKGIKNNIVSITDEAENKINDKKSNALHNSAGVIWVEQSGAEEVSLGKNECVEDSVSNKSAFRRITIRLASRLDVYMGNGAPITQN